METLRTLSINMDLTRPDEITENTNKGITELSQIF